MSVKRNTIIAVYAMAVASGLGACATTSASSEQIQASYEQLQENKLFSLRQTTIDLARTITSDRFTVAAANKMQQDLDVLRGRPSPNNYIAIVTPEGDLRLLRANGHAVSDETTETATEEIELTKSERNRKQRQEKIQADADSRASEIMSQNFDFDKRIDTAMNLMRDKDVMNQAIGLSMADKIYNEYAPSLDTVSNIMQEQYKACIVVQNRLKCPISQTNTGYGNVTVAPVNSVTFPKDM